MSQITNRFITSGSASAGQLLTADGAGNSNWTTSGSSPTAAYSSAYFGTGSSWTSNSTTFSDPGNSGGNTLTIRQSAGITLTSAASNVCGITFTPANSSDIYLVTAAILCFNSGAFDGFAISLQLTDGSTPITTGAAANSGAGGPGLCTLSGIYAPGTSSPVTVKIQVASTSSGVNAGIGTNGYGVVSQIVEWTIVRIA